jgi:hypothetical protein
VQMAMSSVWMRASWDLRVPMRNVRLGCSAAEDSSTGSMKKVAYGERNVGVAGGWRKT